MAKLNLIALDPHFLKRVSRGAFEHTDDIGEASGLQLQCPACFWVDQRVGSETLGHAILLWGNPRWRFAGRGYRDLSLLAGTTTVTMCGCHARFYIKGGKVDFGESPEVRAAARNDVLQTVGATVSARRPPPLFFDAA